MFARFNYSFTLPDGSTTTARTMAYYRLADGKIVVNDVMSVPARRSAGGALRRVGARSRTMTALQTSREAYAGAARAFEMYQIAIEAFTEAHVRK